MGKDKASHPGLSTSPSPTVLRCLICHAKSLSAHSFRLGWPRLGVGFAAPVERFVFVAGFADGRVARLGPFV